MFAPKGCVTRWPNVAPRSQQKKINNQLRKICKEWKRQLFSLWKCMTSGSVTPASPCTTPTGSGWGVHSDHTWQADQPWESILDEKSGIKVLYFNHLLHYLNSAVFPLSTEPEDIKISPGLALLVQRRLDPAEESTLTTPDRLTSLGNQSWMKNRVLYIKVLNFNHLLHCLNSAVFLPSVCFVLLQNEKGKESCVTH